MQAARARAGADDADRPLSFVGFLEGDPAAAAALAMGKGGGRGKGKKGAAAAAAAAAAPERKQYRQASSEAQLNAVMATYLAAYNAVVPSTLALNLVLFGAARQHVVRIARCLSQPGGHALLMGVGGSGRRSLSRLAATMAGCLIVEIDQAKSYSLNDWKEDAKSLMMRAGAEGRPLALILADTSIVHEVMLEGEKEGSSMGGRGGAGLPSLPRNPRAPPQMSTTSSTLARCPTSSRPTRSTRSSTRWAQRPRPPPRPCR